MKKHLAALCLSVFALSTSQASTVIFIDPNNDPIKACQKEIEAKGQWKWGNYASYNFDAKDEDLPSILIDVQRFLIGPVYAKCAIKHVKNKGESEIGVFDKDYNKNGFSNGVRFEK